MDNKPLRFREAERRDIPHLLEMLADDELGKLREHVSTPVNECYLLAFDQICRDPNNELIVVQQGRQIAGMLQLTFIPYLTHKGSWRCLIEGVRIQKAYRGLGLGTRFFKWAISRAGERDCAIVQLTSDKRRHDALRFYQNLGFEASHEGFKMKLSEE
ncbi:MAG: GNAT family N-acetyltransferase [Proteobacteria bacterium]|nr:GNAT family N-acetyltransferase [Pseudomonadota bacterium]